MLVDAVESAKYNYVIVDEFRNIAAQFGAEVVDLEIVHFSPELLRSISAELVHQCRVLPVFESGDRLIIAMSDPSDLPALDRLQTALNREIEIQVAKESQLNLFIERLYGPYKPSA